MLVAFQQLEFKLLIIGYCIFINNTLFDSLFYSTVLSVIAP